MNTNQQQRTQANGTKIRLNVGGKIVTASLTEIECLDMVSSSVTSTSDHTRPRVIVGMMAVRDDEIDGAAAR